MADVEKTYKLVVDASDAIKVTNEVKDALEETNKAAKDVKKSSTDLGGSFRDLKDKMSLSSIASGGFVNGLKAIKTGLTSVIKEMWLLVANPIGLVIAGIAAVAAGLYLIFRKFKPVTDAIEQGFAAIAAIGNVIINVFQGLFTGSKSLTESFSGLGGKMKQAAIEARDLAKAQQELGDTAAALDVANAKSEQLINQYVLQSKNRTITDKERQEYLKKAEDEDNARYERNKARVAEELRVAQEALKIKFQLDSVDFKRLKDGGVEVAREFEGRKDEAEEEIQALKNAELAKIAIDDESTKRQEKIQNAKDASADAAAAKREAAEAKNAERVLKAKEDELKAMDDLLKLYVLQGKMNAQELYDYEIKIINKRLEYGKISNTEAEIQNLEAFNKKKALLDKELQLIKDINAEIEKVGQDDFDKQAEKDELELEQSIAANTKIIDESNKIIETQKQKELTDAQQLQDAKFEIARQGIEAIKGLDQAAVQFSINIQNRLLKDKKITQEQYDVAIAEIQKKAAKREKAYAVASTIINTAAAIVGMLKNPGGIPGIALSVATGILGAAQIAKIIATPIDGGGGGSSSGSVISAPESVQQTAPNTSFTFAEKSTVSKQDISKTYVLSKDVTTQQQLDRAIIANGTV